MAAMGPCLGGLLRVDLGLRRLLRGALQRPDGGETRNGIRVVSERGVPISGAQAVVRNLVGSVDGLFPFFYQTALASMILSPRFQRLGDLAAGTMVVIEERRWRRGVTRIDDPDVDALLPWLPGRIAAGSDLARVLSDYVEARRRFGPLRRAEMAEPLARPLRKRFGLSDKYSGRRRPLRRLSPDFRRRINGVSDGPGGGLRVFCRGTRSEGCIARRTSNGRPNALQ